MIRIDSFLSPCGSHRPAFATILPVLARPLILTAAAVTALGSVGCGASKTNTNPAGVDLDDAGGGDAGLACPRGFAVVDSDYQSTNVSIVSPNGDIGSQSVISSTTAAGGSAATLSSDVVLPLERPASGRLVLIDRGNNALTFVDPASAAVTLQIAVGTGFASNPHDYLEIDASKAYVTRYGSNEAPGTQMFDSGGDVLVVDHQTGALTASIPLGSLDDAYTPCADRMVRVGGDVWVSLQRFNADFSQAGDARIVGIDATRDAAAWTLDLPGLASCFDFAVSPSRTRIAFACSGLLGATGNDGRSGVVVFDPSTRPPSYRTYAVASMLDDATLSPSLAFTSDDMLVGVATSGDPTTGHDLVYTLSLSDGALSDAGSPGNLSTDGSAVDSGSPADGDTADTGSPADGSPTDGGSPADDRTTDGGSPADDRTTDGGSPADGITADGGAPADGNGNARVLFQASGAYVLGDLACNPGCTDLCLLADAETGKNGLRKLPIVDGRPTASDDVVAVDPTLGLPPRSIGALGAP